MNAIPICGSPALLVKTKGERVLVVADLHLGIESELTKRGMALPSQIPRAKEELVRLMNKHQVNRLIFLGDVKHNIPIASWREWRELPQFFEELTQLARVDIVRGNHDGGIEGMISKNVTVHDARGIVLGKRKRIGLMHGHTWPSPDLLDTQIIVMGHNHPVIELRDKFGGKVIEPIWIRAGLNVKKFPKKLRPQGEDSPKLLVMPAFSKLVGGAIMNRELPEEYIGPIFKAGAVELEEAEAYLLDGTFLGKLANLSK